MGDTCSIDACLKEDSTNRDTNMYPARRDSRDTPTDGDTQNTTTTAITDANHDDKINELAKMPYHSVSNPTTDDKNNDNAQNNNNTDNNTNTNNNNNNNINKDDYNNNKDTDDSNTNNDYSNTNKTTVINNNYSNTNNTNTMDENDSSAFPDADDFDDSDRITISETRSRKMSDAVPYATDYSTDITEELSDLGPIAEEKSIPDGGHGNKPFRPDALLQKHKSRKLILPKHGSEIPVCHECQGTFHIQDDPFNAYNGVGIVCDICGENREHNPELIMQEYYYKCEACETVDICSICYQKLKNDLKQN